MAQVLVIRRRAPRPSVEEELLARAVRSVHGGSCPATRWSGLSVQTDVERHPRSQPTQGVDTVARMRALIASLPTWAWVTGVVAVSTAIQIRAGRQILAPFVFGDELTYSELGRSFAETGHFALRSVPNSSYGIVYPLLIAPAYALSKNAVQAYAFVKAINAVVMSLAAVPTYFIARRVLRRDLALLACVLAVAIPSLVYTGMVMTESAFYPAFLVCVLTMMRALERPNATRQLAVLGCVGFAFLIRAQAIVLIPAYITAILLLGWLEPDEGSRRGGLRRRTAVYRLTWLSLLLGGAFVLTVQVARGRSPMDLLGAYKVVAGDMHPLGIPRWFLYHLADLDLYLGIVPFAACLVVFPRALRGLHGEAYRIFAVVTTSVSLSMILLVSAFSSSSWGLGRLHERNLFYIAPLLLIGFLIWFELGSQRPRVVTLWAAVVAASLPPMLPYGELFQGSLVEALGVLAWATTLIRPGVVPLAMGFFSLTLAGLFVVLPRRLTPILIFLVTLNLWIVANQATLHAQAASHVLGSTRVHRNWIDAAVGADADVAAVWFPSRVVCATQTERAGRSSALWQNEFFNQGVRRVYYVVQPAPDGLPAQRLSVDSRTHLLVPMQGTQLSARFLAVDEGVRIRAPIIASDPQTRTILYRLDRNAYVIPPPHCPAFASASTSG